MKDETETFEKFGKSKICDFLKKVSQGCFCIKNTVQMQFLFYFNIFVNLIYDAKLNFQHHYSVFIVTWSFRDILLICWFAASLLLSLLKMVVLLNIFMETFDIFGFF